MGGSVKMLAMTTRILVAATLLTVAPASAIALPLQQDTARATKTEDPKKATDAPRDAAPDSAREAERRASRMRAAENRALFASKEPFKFSLIANFGAIARDRDTLSTKRF